jgi:hypothetical protein
LKKAIQLMELKGETELQNPLLHTDLHWVEVPKPGETWTLFIRGETEPREWGFVPDINTGVWIQHEEYLESQRKK